MNEGKNVSEALLKGIDIFVTKKLKDYPVDKTVIGTIKGVNVEKNLYDVSIQNVIYKDIPSIFSGFSFNDSVKVKIPQNQYSLMYIEGKLNMESMFSDTVTSVNGKVGAVIVKEDKEYIHTQLEGARVWNIKHNLNKFPSVTIIDSGNNEVIGDVNYINENEIKISFTYPFSGKAYLN